MFITGAKLKETDVNTKVFALNSTYIFQRVINYIEKIAKDYAKKDIFDANQIDAELAFAKSSKMINKDDEKYNHYTN